VGNRRRLDIVVIALAIVGCKRAPTKQEQQAPSPVRSAAPAPDRLAKGEVPEGRERAFTMPLPLRCTVKARFPDSVHVATPLTQEDLANFTRARVKDGITSTGASGTRFEGVVVARDPSRRLTIEIRPSATIGDYKSEMVVNDVTRPPEDPNITTDERWRKAGMTPNGKLIDPKKLQ
jgi:hypothetical protein